jgi:hypothetical protein
MEAQQLLNTEPQKGLVNYKLKNFNFLISSRILKEKEKQNLKIWFTPFLKIGIYAFRFLFVGPRMIRKQGLDLKELERHEFETVQMRGPFLW